MITGMNTTARAFCPGMNFTARAFSPVTLNQAWPEVSRLVFVGLGACISMIFNGFFVASFFVEDSLKRVGLVFLACAGAADLMITNGVMPTSAVVLLSRCWDTDGVCYFLQFLTAASTYSYSVFFALTAAESYYRLCRPAQEYNVFISMRVCVVAVAVFTISFITAGVGVGLGFDYDYCRRRHYGNFYFRIVTDCIFHFIPCFFTIFCFVKATLAMIRRAKAHGNYRRSSQYENDLCLNNLNMTAYLLYFTGWLPYVLTVYETPGAPDSKFYYSVWFGVARSVLTSFMYGVLDTSFRRAFAHLFNYFCCKSTLSGSFASRRRRNHEHACNAAEVRVHIMHQVMSSSSPQRATSSPRETQEL